MKTETALVPITRYRDDNGEPVCGECVLMDRDYWCRYHAGYCPVWEAGVAIVGEEKTTTNNQICPKCGSNEILSKLCFPTDTKTCHNCHHVFY